MYLLKPSQHASSPPSSPSLHAKPVAYAPSTPATAACLSTVLHRRNAWQSKNTFQRQNQFALKLVGLLRCVSSTGAGREEPARSEPIRNAGAQPVFPGSEIPGVISSIPCDGDLWSWHASVASWVSGCRESMLYPRRSASAFSK